jgi:DNA-directed RNA polymerase specialized sigma24 family protein
VNSREQEAATWPPVNAEGYFASSRFTRLLGRLATVTAHRFPMRQEYAQDAAMEVAGHFFTAEDATQQTLSDDLSRFPTESHLFRWLLIKATFRVYSLLRKERRRNTFPAGSLFAELIDHRGDVDVLEGIIRAEDCGLLLQFIQCDMSGVDQMIMCERLAGRSYKSISAKIGLSGVALRKRVSRAKEVIRKSIHLDLQFVPLPGKRGLSSRTGQHVCICVNQGNANAKVNQIDLQQRGDRATTTR